MPRPNVLTSINWEEVISKSQTFEKWIEIAEFKENSTAIISSLKTLDFDLSSLKKLIQKVTVIAIAEDWCGDVIRHVPCLEYLKRGSSLISTCYLARSDRPDVFSRFLTNGGEAVPKFIFLNEKNTEFSNWGPMTNANRILISKGKAIGDIPSAREEVSNNYQSDLQCKLVLKELTEIFLLAAK